MRNIWCSSPENINNSLSGNKQVSNNGRCARRASCYSLAEFSSTLISKCENSPRKSWRYSDNECACGRWHLQQKHLRTLVVFRNGCENWRISQLAHVVHTVHLIAYYHISLEHIAIIRLALVIYQCRNLKIFIHVPFSQLQNWQHWQEENLIK